MHGFAQIVSLAVAVAPFVAAQSPVWGQCGGTGWTGATTCASGSTCVASNQYYSQCIPGSASTAPTSTANSGTGSSTPVSTSPTGVSTGVGLNKHAKAIGKLYLGSATDNPEITDTAYMKILDDTNEFGQLTAGNSLKWDATEPEQNTFSFSGGDAIWDIAKANGQMFRGHNLVWYQQLPDWVSSGTWTNATLTAAMQNHITNVVEHYKGDFYCWDVVNEPLNDDGTLRSTVFSENIGEEYIAIALKAAKAADPSVKLYINDYNIEGTGAKSTAMQTIVKNLKAQGAPIDGIGFESHFIVGELPSDIQANMEAFVALGVEVAITELDIRMTLPSTPALLAQQQQDYQTVITACANVPKCIGITLWDYTDKYSWVPGTFSGQGAACPWDQNLLIKPAYNGIIAGLAA